MDKRKGSYNLIKRKKEAIMSNLKTLHCSLLDIILSLCGIYLQIADNTAGLFLCLIVFGFFFFFWCFLLGGGGAIGSKGTRHQKLILTKGVNATAHMATSFSSHCK